MNDEIIKLCQTLNDGTTDSDSVLEAFKTKAKSVGRNYPLPDSLHAKEHVERYCQHTEELEKLAATKTPEDQSTLERPNYRFCNFDKAQRTNIFTTVEPNHERWFDGFATEDFSKDLLDSFEQDHDFAYCKMDHALGFDVPDIPTIEYASPPKIR